MSGKRYYTLLASLPPLPPFDRAERLPISRRRLLQRLRMLDEEDAELVNRLASFLQWELQRRDRTDAAIVAEYRQMEEELRGTLCHRLVEDTVTRRTVVVALRRRELGRPAPEPGEPWGLGPYAEPLRRNWEHPDFRLAAVFSWIPRARRLLSEGESRELEHLLNDLAWRRVGELRPPNPFHFDSLLVYLFQWSLLERWLSYDADAARVRFDELIAEAIGEYDELLH